MPLLLRRPLRLMRSHGRPQLRWNHRCQKMRGARMAISDILGLGYAHAIAAGAAHYHPLSGNRPVFQDRAIAQRWNRLWLVACAMASKRFADPAAELHNFKVSHRQRVVSLLDAGIPWNTI